MKYTMMIVIVYVVVMSVLIGQEIIKRNHLETITVEQAQKYLGLSPISFSHVNVGYGHTLVLFRAVADDEVGCGNLLFDENNETVERVKFDRCSFKHDLDGDVKIPYEKNI